MRGEQYNHRGGVHPRERAGDPGCDESPLGAEMFDINYEDEKGMIMVHGDGTGLVLFWSGVPLRNGRTWTDAAGI